MEQSTNLVACRDLNNFMMSPLGVLKWTAYPSRWNIGGYSRAPSQASCAESAHSRADSIKFERTRPPQAARLAVTSHAASARSASLARDRYRRTSKEISSLRHPQAVHTTLLHAPATLDPG